MGVLDEVNDEVPTTEDSNSEEVQPEGDGAPPPPETGTEEGTPDEGELSQGEETPTSDFELEGVSFQGLTQEQLDAIEKGTLRVKDYTQKTQQLAEMEKGMKDLHQNMLRDPRIFLQYFPRDYLEYVMSGLKPQASNDGNDGIDLSQFDDASQKVISSLMGEVKTLKNTIGQYDRRLGKYDDWISNSETSQVENDLTAEVDEAVKKYPSLNNEYDKGLIYSQIAKDGNLTATQVAANINKLKKQSRSEKITSIGSNKTKVVGAGRSTPPVQKKPQTYEDADKLIDQRLGLTGG